MDNSESNIVSQNIGLEKNSKRGRPKGAKNKPKRGRPKLKKVKQKQIVDEQQTNITNGNNLKVVAYEDDSIGLDDSKLTEIGYNIDSEKIINSEPISDAFYYRGSKTIPIAGAQYQFTEHMIQEIKRCKEDIIYFAENYFFITTLDKGKQKISLYEAQKRVLRTFVKERHAIVCSSRQIGKSTMLTVFSLWMVCFNCDYRAAIVANKETTAINIFKRIRMAYEQLPNFVKPGVKEYGKTGMTLGNDSSIIVSTTTATSIRGDTLNCVLMDEAAYIEPHLLKDFWSSVIPTVSSGKNSKILVVSTPNGVGNKFYEIYSGAENGKLPEWKAERIDWWDVPGRDENWKKVQIALLGSEEEFLKEYNNTFLDDASTAVGALVIESFKKNKKDPIWSSLDNEYLIFEFPDKKSLYVIGVDVGEGIGRASSVAQVLDVTDLQNIKQVAVFGSSVTEPYHFARKLATLGSSWGFPPILIERNNCGAQLIDALYYQYKYEKLVSYAKISEQDKYNKTRNIGVLSHTNIRFDGIQNMRYWINHLQTVHINDSQTISEFETFVRYPNGTYKKSGEGVYDDRVMALVWALFILVPDICQQYFDIINFDERHKPLKIASNQYWENKEENFIIKDLHNASPVIVDYNSSALPKPFKTFDVTQDELEELDKYNLDLETLQELGFQLYTPHA